MVSFTVLGCIATGELPTNIPATEGPATPTTTVNSSTSVSPTGMVSVPAGEFQMGLTEDQYQEALTTCEASGMSQSNCQDLISNEIPGHTVYLDAFLIDQTEVTQAQFEQFVNDSGYKTDAEKQNLGFVFDFESVKWVGFPETDWKNPGGPWTDRNVLGNYPAAQISWNDAAAYCEWAGRRLPTEAEWEKAARGTDGRLYPWGNQALAANLLNFADKSLKSGWSDNNIDDGYAFTSPVGSYPDGASPYGALDMAGNVGEWVADWYGETYYTETATKNPTGPTSGEFRVLRGGSWLYSGYFARTTSRAYDAVTNHYHNVGFRCAVSQP